MIVELRLANLNLLGYCKRLRRILRHSLEGRVYLDLVIARKHHVRCHSLSFLKRSATLDCLKSRDLRVGALFVEVFIAVDVGGRLGIARHVVLLAFPASAGRIFHPPLSRIVVLGRGV